MSLAAEGDFGKRPGPREIAAEASNAFPSPPSYEEMWGRPMRDPKTPRGVSMGRRRPFAVKLAAAILVATAVIGLRGSIVRVAPATAAVFRAAGVPVNPLGLEIRELHSRVVLDGGRKVLVTEGEIVNLRRDQNHVPALTLAVRGENGLDRYAWSIPAPKTQLASGEKVAFRARLASPPEDGADVVARFAKPEEGKAEAGAKANRKRF
jgi:hypothetical protein